MDIPWRVTFNELQLARDLAAFARCIDAGILDGMFKVEQHTHLFTAIGGIDQHGALGEQVAALLKYQVQRHIQ